MRTALKPVALVAPGSSSTPSPRGSRRRARPAGLLRVEAVAAEVSSLPSIKLPRPVSVSGLVHRFATKSEYRPPS
eukprot:16449187-Heterocapsa_arctica.AAC.1